MFDLSKISEMPILLTDKNGNSLKLGDTVEATCKVSRLRKGDRAILVFCVPQYRFGFMSEDLFKPERKSWLEQFSTSEKFVVTLPEVAFYLTPRNVNCIVKVS